MIMDLPITWRPWCRKRPLDDCRGFARRVAGVCPERGNDIPARAIKIIVGFAAGGGTDIVARLVAQKMQESFGQSVFVKNRPGGNSMLGPDIAARSAPDGYTLLFAATGQMAVSPAVYPKIPYQPLRDFLRFASSYPLIMVVNGQHPATTMKDFIAWTKAGPDNQLREHVEAFTLRRSYSSSRPVRPGSPFRSRAETIR